MRGTGRENSLRGLDGGAGWQAREEHDNRSGGWMRETGKRSRGQAREGDSRYGGWMKRAGKRRTLPWRGYAMSASSVSPANDQLRRLGELAAGFHSAF